MDKLQRYCLRFCFLVVLLVVCLTPFSVYAETTYVYDTIDTTTGQWEMDYILSEVDENYNLIAELGSNSDNFSSVSSDLGAYRKSPVSDNMVLNGTNLYHDEIRLFRVDGASMLKNGESFIINLSKLAFQQNGYLSATIKRNSNLDFSQIVKFAVSVVSNDGEVAVVLEKGGEDIDGILSYDDGSQSTRYADLHVEVLNVPFDVYQIVVDIYSGADAWNNNNLESSLKSTSWDWSGAGTRYFGMYSTGEFIFEVEPMSSEGMIAGIVEWIQKIYNSIVNLPVNIWNFIKDGLIDMFVPDAEFMESYKAEWDTVLQDSMGGVYQSVSMIDDFYESFKVSSTQGTIHFPEVSVPVAGETFTFGGYEVDIVPDEAPFLQIVIDGIKLVMNAVCTLAVLQSFKRRYERVVSE